MARLVRWGLVSDGFLFTMKEKVRCSDGYLGRFLGAKLEGVLGGNPTEEAALQRLRLADAARVSEYQLEAIRTILNMVTDPGTMPLRIAATHHHLLPVSAREEVKPFESMTNLGLVRQFLREQGVAIVLHGHKHTESTYVDYISSYRSLPGTPNRIRVISGAAAHRKGSRSRRRLPIAGHSG